MILKLPFPFPGAAGPKCCRSGFVNRPLMLLLLPRVQNAQSFETEADACIIRDHRFRVESLSCMLLCMLLLKKTWVFERMHVCYKEHRIHYLSSLGPRAEGSGVQVLGVCCYRVASSAPPLLFMRRTSVTLSLML